MIEMVRYVIDAETGARRDYGNWKVIWKERLYVIINEIISELAHYTPASSPQLAIDFSKNNNKDK